MGCGWPCSGSCRCWSCFSVWCCSGPCCCRSWSAWPPPTARSGGRPAAALGARPGKCHRPDHGRLLHRPGGRAGADPADPAGAGGRARERAAGLSGAPAGTRAALALGALCPARSRRRPLGQGPVQALFDPVDGRAGRRSQQPAAVGGRAAQSGVAGLRDPDRHLLPAARLGPDGGADLGRGAARPAADRQPARGRHRRGAGGLHPGPGPGLPVPGPVLRSRPVAGRAALWADHRPADRVLLLHPLHRHDDRPGRRPRGRGLPVPEPRDDRPGRRACSRSVSSSRAI